MCVTFSIYALVMKQTLDVFDILRHKMYLSFMWVPMVIKGNVSLQRVNDFLQETELLDEFTEGAQEVLLDFNHNSEDIGFRAASFSWSNEEGKFEGVVTPSKRRFRLHIEDDLLFKRGAFNLVVGSTGKCEMHFVPSGPGAWYNLPRSSGVAYAAQESWVLNATIKDNILFGATFDEERYKKGMRIVLILLRCSLTRDLELLKAGDLTEVGEKGLTLSGGQKVLAALDVHTAKWIVDKCFVGDLVQGRTVLLVTHNVHMVAPISQFVVSLGSEGQILSQGSVSDALAKNPKLKAEVAEETKKEEKTEQEVDADKETKTREEEGKLTVEEESGEGHISWSSVKMYLIAFGGRSWIFFWGAFTTTTVFECAVEVLQPWLLGAWATEYSIHPPEEVNVPFYLTGYVFLVCLMMVVYCIAQTTLTLGALRASASLHRRLIETILGTTLRWLDKTPTSRVITRVTQNVAAGKFDITIPDNFAHLFELGVVILVRFFAILLFTPSTGLFAIIIIGGGGVVGNIYMKAQLSVKREMSKAKAPVLAHFGASIEGITLAVEFGRLVLAFVLILNMFEVNGNSLQRLQEYMVIEQEPKPTPSGEPPASWPTSGSLEVRNLTARYAPDSPDVLHGLNFDLRSGERMGIVGRTGSGKSSLTLALLRCIVTGGEVRYDGLSTGDLNLGRLREGVTIIPQVPELLSGTLRHNLDPFDQFDDATLNAALRDAGLYALQSEDDESRITLDSAVARSGSNLSFGASLATSAIDYKTDSIIQASLRTQLNKDVTVITVAHRLQTIMDADRIMVLDAGNIIEFDAPYTLLQKDGGFLRSLVDESGDREALIEAAAAKAKLA
ncbi:hypothetical protein DXG01_011996 [Tephrocybe rancida]|nr:hypothetical protein DXG01_011996 [Tephrocybe rancida]